MLGVIRRNANSLRHIEGQLDKDLNIVNSSSDNVIKQISIVTLLSVTKDSLVGDAMYGDTFLYNINGSCSTMNLFNLTVDNRRFIRKTLIKEGYLTNAEDTCVLTQKALELLPVDKNLKDMSTTEKNIYLGMLYIKVRKPFLMGGTIKYNGNYFVLLFKDKLNNFTNNLEENKDIEKVLQEYTKYVQEIDGNHAMRKQNLYSLMETEGVSARQTGNVIYFKLSRDNKDVYITTSLVIVKTPDSTIIMKQFGLSNTSLKQMVNQLHGLGLNDCMKYVQCQNLNSGSSDKSKKDGKHTYTSFKYINMNKKINKQKKVKGVY